MSEQEEMTNLEQLIWNARKKAKEEAEIADKTKKIKTDIPTAYTMFDGMSRIQFVFRMFMHVNIREYYRAIAIMTGDENDRIIPKELSRYKDRCIQELLRFDDCSNSKLLERIYLLLIEPFAKIGRSQEEKGV